MLILVINSGSSSIKFQLFDMHLDLCKVKGMVERIGLDQSSLVFQKLDGVRTKIKMETPTHKEAMAHIFETLTDPKNEIIRSMEEVAGIGHRVVHGGEEFSESTIITDEVLASITKFCELAPLHNPPAVLAIKACKKMLPGKPQVAVFDTAFHQSIPEQAYLYALPYKYYQRYHIRRYGFHGTSHRYVAREAAKKLNRPIEELKIITCHLGNGCSITAVKEGKSVETSMGFTPLEGLIMGTRSGDLDPAIIAYLCDKEKLTADKVIEILNKTSGLAGISGLTNDYRDLLKAAEENNTRAKLAIEMFFYRIKKYIGAYMAVMNGVDAIVFTAGIGENQPILRERVAKELSNIIDPQKVKILVIATNEELTIAHDTFEIINAQKKTVT